mmetsp:Transcript_34950/g.52157  ORF Transcript_34950/g.52157 Transcript_34950/m.52157 type:complete len:95 (+) Transcript_34950:478-762(+)
MFLRTYDEVRAFLIYFYIVDPHGKTVSPMRKQEHFKLPPIQHQYKNKCPSELSDWPSKRKTAKRERYLIEQNFLSSLTARRNSFQSYLFIFFVI